jgi:hypothetical protein
VRNTYIHIYICIYVLQGHILNTAGDALTVPCWFLGEITKSEREREKREKKECAWA